MRKQKPIKSLASFSPTELDHIQSFMASHSYNETIEMIQATYDRRVPKTALVRLFQRSATEDFLGLSDDLSVDAGDYIQTCDQAPADFNAANFKFMERKLFQAFMAEEWTIAKNIHGMLYKEKTLRFRQQQPAARLKSVDQPATPSKGVVRSALDLNETPVIPQSSALDAKFSGPSGSLSTPDESAAEAENYPASQLARKLIAIGQQLRQATDPLKKAVLQKEFEECESQLNDRIQVLMAAQQSSTPEEPGEILPSPAQPPSSANSAEETSPSPRQIPATQPPEPGRNAPCPCGSGLKFKKCCLTKNASQPRA